MRFAMVAVAVCVLVAGCSGQKVSTAEGLAGQEPAEVGFTGVDQPVPQESLPTAGELAEIQDGSNLTAENEKLDGASSLPLQGVKLFPELPSETPSEDDPAARVLSLGAAEAVVELHRQGFSSQEICGAPEFIPDYAEAEDFTYAVITDENAVLTARDAANAVWEYYSVVSQTHQQPAPQKLLCLSHVAMLPKLEWKWADLRELVSAEASVSYLLPDAVHVVGLMTGNALAVACLPPMAYGELSLNDGPIAAALILQWAGSRWRVSVAEDASAADSTASPTVSADGSDFCDRHVQAQQAEFADDISDTGERWRFGPWSFTADQLRQTATQEVQQ